MKYKILLTGSSGYIGSCFNAIFHKKLDIYCLDQTKPNFFSNFKKKNFFKCNLLNKKKLENIIYKVKPDIIIHLGAQSTVNEKIKWSNYYRNNIKATKNLIEIMNKFNVRKLIFSSTASVYRAKKKKLSENDQLKPSSKYGKSKMLAENLIMKNKDINHIILRFFNVSSAIRKPIIGEFHDPETHLIPVSITKIFNDEVIEIFGNNYKTKDGTCERDYIHIKDICNAIYNSINLLLKKNNNYLFNIGNGKTISNLEIIKSLEKIFKKKIKFKFSHKRSGDNPRLFCDTKKAKKMINWNSKNSEITKIIKDEVYWYKFLVKNKIKRKLLSEQK